MIVSIIQHNVYYFFLKDIQKNIQKQQYMAEDGAIDEVVPGTPAVDPGSDEKPEPPADGMKTITVYPQAGITNPTVNGVPIITAATMLWSRTHLAATAVMEVACLVAIWRRVSRSRSTSG